MKVTRAFSALMFLVLASAVAKEPPNQAVNADTRERFERVSSGIRQEMEPGGRYEFVTRKERETIEQRFQQMQALFERFDEVSRMEDREKVALFNAQEAVNGILTRRDADRLVCESRAPIGSNIPVRACKTYREVRNEERIAKNYMRERQFVPCNGEGKFCPVAK